MNDTYVRPVPQDSTGANEWYTIPKPVNAIGNYSLGTPCLICGESISIDYYTQVPRICTKCKNAVLKVRKEMESEEDK